MELKIMPYSAKINTTDSMLSKDQRRQKPPSHLIFVLFKSHYELFCQKYLSVELAVLFSIAHSTTKSPSPQQSLHDWKLVSRNIKEKRQKGKLYIFFCQHFNTRYVMCLFNTSDFGSLTYVMIIIQQFYVSAN